MAGSEEVCDDFFFSAHLDLCFHTLVGDFVILDNARIHCAAAVLPILHITLQIAGVQLIYLPPYSMELNACELVFGWLKCYTQRHSQSDNLLFAIIHALQFITPQQVRNTIDYCVDKQWQRV